MLHAAGLSLRDLSERYHITMASKENVRRWFPKFSRIFSVEWGWDFVKTIGSLCTVFMAVDAATINDPRIPMEANL